MGLKVFLIRIGVCFVLSVLIGIERQYRHKLVGLRTNVLVSLGAFMFNWVAFASNIPDKTRIAAQIVSGIGFLGAGVIIHDNGSKIKGLNTAATLWCVAAVGVLTSTGLLIEAAVGTLLVLFSNILLRFISMAIMNKVSKNQKEICILRLSMKENIEVVVRTKISKNVERNNLGLKSLEKHEIANGEVKLKAIIITSRYEEVENLVKNISKEPGITSISWEHQKMVDYDNEDV